MENNVPQIVKEFFEQFPSRTWGAGHILVHAGDNPEGVYYIEKGAVRQYAVSEKGDEVILTSFKPGAFFPMSWALARVQNKYFFETSEESTIRFATVEQAVELLHKNPEVTLDLLSRMYSGVDAILSRMTHLLSGTAYERIVNELILQTRRLTKSADVTDVVLPLKEYELGMFCGLTKETVSREFKKLKAKQLVSVNSNGIVVHDLKALSAELE